jgi:hypothetical protein
MKWLWVAAFWMQKCTFSGISFVSPLWCFVKQVLWLPCKTLTKKRLLQIRFFVQITIAQCALDEKAQELLKSISLPLMIDTSC